MPLGTAALRYRTYVHTDGSPFIPGWPARDPACSPVYSRYTALMSMGPTRGSGQLEFSCRPEPAIDNAFMHSQTKALEPENWDRDRSPESVKVPRRNCLAG
ncbi:hypothetical protein B0H17DRAFT_663735 [Mycena rosella]|uniref:Uncharacterized protein n=1 Tax=Mycena rosella TaxID=1033263 RepID=A0AAD7GU65_MYCRO|nr:hypothetical protein B0H17DRAFT_663735 [Mycena rosella]